MIYLLNVALFFIGITHTALAKDLETSLKKPLEASKNLENPKPTGKSLADPPDKKNLKGHEAQNDHKTQIEKPKAELKEVSEKSEAPLKKTALEASKNLGNLEVGRASEKALEQSANLLESELNSAIEDTEDEINRMPTQNFKGKRDRRNPSNAKQLTTIEESY